MARLKKFDENMMLAKAMDLFWIKGYQGASAQDIVDALGLNRSSIYNTFIDKKSLFIKALKYYQDKNTKALVQLINNSKNAEKTLQQIFSNIIAESKADTLKKGCFMVNTAVEVSVNDSEIHAVVNLNNQIVEEALTRLIRDGQDQGIFSRKFPPEKLALYIFSSISGLRVSARTGSSTAVLKDISAMVLLAIK